MVKGPKKRSVYLIYLIASIVLILLAQAYEAGSDSSRSSANIEAIINIAVFLYFIVYAYKFFFTKSTSLLSRRRQKILKAKGNKLFTLISPEFPLRGVLVLRTILAHHSMRTSVIPKHYTQYIFTAPATVTDFSVFN